MPTLGGLREQHVSSANRCASNLVAAIARVPRWPCNSGDGCAGRGKTRSRGRRCPRWPSSRVRGPARSIQNHTTTTCRSSQRWEKTLLPLHRDCWLGLTWHRSPGVYTPPRNPRRRRAGHRFCQDLPSRCLGMGPVASLCLSSRPRQQRQLSFHVSRSCHEVGGLMEVCWCRKSVRVRRTGP